jgi:hypothetical protein
LPVCDVGTHSDWVANYAEMKLPCCCGMSICKSTPSNGNIHILIGVGCSETKTFMKAANMAAMKSVNDACTSQFPDYKSAAKRFISINISPYFAAMLLAMPIILFT